MIKPLMTLVLFPLKMSLNNLGSLYYKRCLISTGKYIDLNYFVDQLINLKVILPEEERFSD